MVRLEIDKTREIAGFGHLGHCQRQIRAKDGQNHEDYNQASIHRLEWCDAGPCKAGNDDEKIRPSLLVTCFAVAQKKQASIQRLQNGAIPNVRLTG